MRSVGSRAAGPRGDRSRWVGDSDTGRGQKLSPLVRIETDCRLAFARLLRELDLDVDPPAEAKRPPSLRAFRGKDHDAA